MDSLNLFASNAATFNPLQIIVNICLAFFLALGIAFIYKKTHVGISYSKSFVVTLILLSVLISVVIAVIGNSLAKAFTLLGAFTIIRFRTAIKDTKDTAFVFWSLVTGMAVGTGNYILSLIATVMIGFIIFILHRFNFGSMRHYEHLLNFILDTTQNSSDAYKNIFEKYIKGSDLINVATKEDGVKKLDFSFTVRLINPSDESSFVDELSRVRGISNINFIAASKNAEY